MSTSLLGRFPEWNARFTIAADWIACGALALLPWSTTLAGALTGLWLLVFLPTLDWGDGVRRWREPVIGLPIALFLYSFLAILWTEAPWWDSIVSAIPYIKFWVLALLIVHFAKSPNVLRITLVVLASVLLLVLVSWVTYFFPELMKPDKLPGMPVSNRIYLGGFFALATCCLVSIAPPLFRQGRAGLSALCALGAAILFANIVLVTGSRTAMVVLLVVMPIALLQSLSLRSSLYLSAAALVAAVLVTGVSEKARVNILEAVTGATVSVDQSVTNENLRLAFWEKAIEIIREHPVLGHGIGDTSNAFAVLVGSKPAGATNNPHNQTLMTGAQLGLVGIVLLWGMWLAHLLGSIGERWEARLCFLVVTQNIVSSQLNSHLSDFTSGWLYVFAVGILGGAIWANRAVASAGSSVLNARASP